MAIDGISQQYGSYKTIKTMSIIILIIFLMVEGSVELQLHQQASPVQSTIYNQTLYLQALTQIQTTFKNDLLKIQATFTKLNSYLNNTNISSSSQIIKLQQSLASESNALYNIQTYLNVPFALKSCECLNFTSQQRSQLQSQVNSVDSQIKVLLVRLYQNSSGNPYVNKYCPNGNCPMVNQLKKQISQLNNYARIMNDTLNSNCCNRTLYIFRDNLLANASWIYGNTTLKKYQAQLLLRANGTKIATCPPSLPFVNVTTNGCFLCPSQLPVYDLSKGKCVPSCTTKGLILVMKTHQCGYNTTCNSGYYFNNVSNKCEISLGSSSRCPLNTPYWNQANLSCQLCPKATPYFDVAIRSCRACTVNQFYDPFNRICYSKLLYPSVPCKNGTAFNSITSKCQSLNVNNVTSTNNTNVTTNVLPSGNNSGCSPATPYFNPVALVCSKCPTSKPHYNNATKTCESCPANTIWNNTLAVCINLKTIHNCSINQYWDAFVKKCISYPNCTSGQYFNNVTKRCVNLPSVGQTGFCPPSAPHWNPVSLACQKCPLKTPLFNSTSKVCQSCPKNYIYVVSSNICKVNITCLNGTIYNSTTGTCQKPVCSTSKPIFDTVTGICTACPTGTTYDPTTKTCKVPVLLQSASSACPPSAPYWNPARLACEVCPLGQRISPTTHLCVPGVSHLLGLHNANRHQLANML